MTDTVKGVEIDPVREKLIELLHGAINEACKICGETTCKKCKYEKYGLNCKYAARADYFIANGVTVFPCKIGDEFWTEWVGIRKVRCSMLTQKADGSLKGRFTVENSGGASIDVAFNGHHRKLFLTKEEAEEYFAKPPKGE